MSFYNFSEATQEMTFIGEAAKVAEACQLALSQVGKVTEVRRETGTISGKIGWLGLSYSEAIFDIKVAKESAGTKIQIKVRVQQDAKGDGSTKAIAKFTMALSRYQNLTGESQAGW